MKNSEIQSYRDILHFEYNRRREEVSAYTLKQFSQDCGLPGNRMTDILNKRYGISKKRAEDMVEKIGLDDYHKELFILSVEAEHSRNMSSRKSAREKLRSFLFKPDRVYSDVEFSRIFDWYKFALIELMRHPQFKNNLKWLAKKLTRTQKEVEATVEELIDLGSVSSFQGIYHINSQFLSTQTDIPSQAIRNYHKQVLDIAKENIEKTTVDKRDYSSINFLCRPEDLPKIKSKIKSFRQELVSEFEVCEDQSELYCMNIQLFSPNQTL